MIIQYNTSINGSMPSTHWSVELYYLTVVYILLVLTDVSRKIYIRRSTLYLLLLVYDSLARGDIEPTGQFVLIKYMYPESYEVHQLRLSLKYILTGRSALRRDLAKAVEIIIKIDVAMKSAGESLPVIENVR
jgi:hypothetical protein